MRHVLAFSTAVLITLFVCWLIMLAGETHERAFKACQLACYPNVPSLNQYGCTCDLTKRFP